MMSSNINAFEYVLVESFQFTDIFRSGNIFLTIPVLTFYLCLLIGVVSDKAQAQNRILRFFGDRKYLFLFLSVFLTLPFLYLIINDQDARQEDLTRATITKDYGLDVINIYPDHMFNRYNASTDVNDVVLQDGEKSLQCKQFIALKDSTYHIECYDQTVLKPLSY